MPRPWSAAANSLYDLLQQETKKEKDNSGILTARNTSTAFTGLFGIVLAPSRMWNANKPQKSVIVMGQF